jgi:hypothetical protein
VPLIHSQLLHRHFQLEKEAEKERLKAEKERSRQEAEVGRRDVQHVLALLRCCTCSAARV